MFRSLQLLLISTMAVTLQAADEPPSSAKAPLYFIIDFLPAAIYDRDGVTASFRIENTTSAPIKVDLTVTSTDRAGASNNERTETLTAAPKGFSSWQLSLNSIERSKFKFTLKNGASTVSEVNVRLLRDDEPWPVARIRNGRLEASDSGEILIPTVTRRSKNKDRAFAPMKWLIKAEKNENAAKSAKALFFLPAQWPLQNASAGTTLTVLSAIERSPAPPILVFADQVIQKLNAIEKPAEGATRDESLFIVLPPDDLDVATDPWIYRITLDAVLARATALRFKKIVLVPAFHYGAKEKFYERLGNEVREAASVYGVTAADPAEYLNETLWRVDPEQAGVYGRVPNGVGLKKIEQGLWNLVP